MSDPRAPVAILASRAAPRSRQTNYPEPFASQMNGREKHPLGDLFGLQNFGLNLTRLAPGARSALHHRHTRQDEFVYVLEGEPTLVHETGDVLLGPGMCAGFPAGGAAHHLENRSLRDVVYLEVGDRAQGDQVSYPRDDLRADLGPDGRWRFTRKDGSAY
ncbi:MAG TPA: cupin domain-containing protein [Myxococcota bacterium]|nr:cupin domain-containing protein [Myxococcota bacterium]